MPAFSKRQRRLMGLALHHPEEVYSKNRSVLKMKGTSLREFAKTPEKGLPYKKRKKR